MLKVGRTPRSAPGPLARLLAVGFLLLTAAQAAHAQDERQVTSPDGQLQFRLFTAVPEGSALNCLAYQVWWHGKPLLDTSYLGLNIHYQEPFLGENVGLISDKPLHAANYNGLFADYLQVSTTGRRIQFEVRVWNDGIAFRYTVPKSALLMELLIEDETTQFYFMQGLAGRPAHAALPYAEEVPGVGWVGIYESPMAGFPPMQLVRSDAHLLAVHLPDKPHDPKVAFEGSTPWTGPWRILAIAPTRDRLAQSEVLRDLLH